MDEVVLGAERVIAADRAWYGLLHGVGSARDLTERGNSTRPLEHGRDQRTRRDELDQRRIEGLALVLRVMLGGEVVADVLEFERGKGCLLYTSPSPRD